MAVLNSEDVKQLMLDMIQEMDLDIVDFRVVEDENDRIDVYTKHLVDGYAAAIGRLVAAFLLFILGISLYILLYIISF